MVFHILLVRDLKAQTEKELDQLLEEAKSWWAPLLEKLRERNPGTTGTMLTEWGLDLHKDVHRADTDKSAGIKLLIAIRDMRIALLSGAATLRGQNLSPDAWQEKFDPIAERVSKLTNDKPNPAPAFYAGVLATSLNLLALALMKWFALIAFSQDLLILGLVLINGSVGIFFVYQVRTALKSV